MDHANVPLLGNDDDADRIRHSLNPGDHPATCAKPDGPVSHLGTLPPTLDAQGRARAAPGDHQSPMDLIDEAMMESFPCSDPPCYTTTHA